jgi:nucleoside-triphosphatase
VKRKIYVITGRPGIGKSTLFGKIVEYAKQKGIIVGGISTPEVRDYNGRRIGFKIIDLLSGEETWLARRNCSSPIRVGSYCVLEGASLLIQKAFSRALNEAQVIGVDEVGPMELRLPAFKDGLLQLFESEKTLILVVHFRLKDKDILNKISDGEWIHLDIHNRDYYGRTLPEKIVLELMSSHGLGDATESPQT